MPTITGTDNPETLIGGGLPDTIYGLGGNDTLYGAGANDTLYGGMGADSMYGGPGDDTYEVDNANDRVIEGAGQGTDRVTALVSWVVSPGQEIEFVKAGVSTPITLVGNTHSDAYALTIVGGAGADLLGDGGDRAVLMGGGGSDRYVVDDPLTQVVEPAGNALAGGAADTIVTALSDYTLPFGVENLEGGNGVSEAHLNGNAGNNLITGKDESDEIDGGAGADTMVGGKGDDAYTVDNIGDVVTEKAGEGSDLVLVGSAWVATPGSEIEFITPFVLTNAQNYASYSITGNAHSDSYTLTIDGASGIDTLSDGGGRALLEGGGGNDTYVVTNPLTTLYEFDNGSPPHGLPPEPDPLLSGYDTVRTNLSTYVLPDDMEVLTYFGSGTFTGTGNSENNVVTGGAGNDTLDGAGGVDRLVGLGGNDTYRVDYSQDVVVEAAGGGFDTILSTASTFVAPANVEALTYVGTGTATLYANATGTVLTGGAGNDTLFGSGGADTLDGDPKNLFDPSTGAHGIGENDVLYGGAGADNFILHPSGFGLSRIIDFTPGTDHLKIVDPSVPPGGDFTTVAPEPVDGGGHDIVSIYYYDKPNGALYYVDFLSGQVDSHLIATFDNHPTLSASDFVFG